MIKRINNTKEPTHYQLKTIPKNLMEKLDNNYVNLEPSYASYTLNSPVKIEYKICFQPGLDGTNCSIEYFKSWPSLLNRYFQIMKEGA